MRKFFVPGLALAVFLPAISMGQTSAKPKKAGNAQFKPGVGLTLTDWSKDGAGDVQGKAGFLLGASVQFGRKVYIEPGIFYVGKNVEVKPVNSLPTTIKSNLNGIRVPLSVGFQLLGNSESAFGLRAFGGGSAFFLTSVSDNLNKDDYSKTNFGLHAGAGLDITIVYVDLAYEWSVTNIQENIGAIDYGKTRGLYLTAGIRF